MQYRVVFDLNQVGFKPENIILTAMGLLFVAIALLFFLFRGKLASRGPLLRMLPFCCLVFSLAWTVGAMGMLFSEYTNDSKALLDGKVSMVEGIVSRFRPMHTKGHATEEFCVRNTCFHYSDYATTPGFNQTSAHGGPIHEGLPVRVTYIGETIVRLEVGEKASATQ